MFVLRKGWGLFFGELKKRKMALFFLVLLAGLGAIIGVGIPYLFGMFIDVLTGPVIDKRMAIILLSVVVSGHLLRFFVNNFKATTARILGARLNLEFRPEVYSRAVKLPLSFFAGNKTGTLISKAEQASKGMRSGLIQGAFLVPDLIAAMAMLVVLFFVSWQIGAIATVGVGIFMVYAALTLKGYSDLEREMKDERDKVSGEVTDRLYNIPLLKEAASEKESIKFFFKSIAGKQLDISINIAKYLFRMWAVKDVIIGFARAGVLAASLYFVLTGSLTVGTLVIISSYITTIFWPFNRLIHYWEDLQVHLTALDDVAEILEKETETYEPQNSKKKQSVQGEIVFDNVSFGYGGKTKKKLGGEHVLRNISLAVAPGQTVALVGRSGAGKSTLVKLLSGYYFPTKGSLAINGTPIEQWNLHTLRSQIAVVPQETTLLNNTIKHNLKFANQRATQDDLERAARQAFALDFIRDFPKKWKQQVGERGIKLSGGQKQRIAIARAILRDPRILILDEPTSALDAESEHCINASLEELMRGRTTFIIAHRLSTIRRADVVVVMDKGKIVQTGSYTELLGDKDGLFRKLYDLQVGVY